MPLGDLPSAPDHLELYCASREALLQRVQERLEQDPRAVAAWLFGSLGRGDGDGLSDLDLWVVVADRHIGDFIDGRRDFVAVLGTPLLLVEAPQNAPDGGAYLMAAYDGPVGPHLVDWYWQPLSLARLPAAARLLLDRAGVPRSDEPVRLSHRDPPPPREPSAAAANAVHFFWAMLLITAKYVARSPWEERMGLLHLVRGPLEETRRFVGTPASPAGDEAPPSRPDEKIRLLRQLASEMEALMPHVAAQGGAVPFAIVSPAHRYLDLIEAISKEE